MNLMRRTTGMPLDTNMPSPIRYFVYTSSIARMDSRHPGWEKVDAKDSLRHGNDVFLQAHQEDKGWLPIVKRVGSRSGLKQGVRGWYSCYLEHPRGQGWTELTDYVPSPSEIQRMREAGFTVGGLVELSDEEIWGGVYA